MAATPLPIDDVLPHLLSELQRSTISPGATAILVAPPGAGKTTRVPAAMLSQAWCTGKVLVLEPRRIAARAAASHVAGERGEAVGDTIGYRVRLETRVSGATRVEYLTEGVFARQVLSDPELSGVSAVIFDEFHERNLDADFGLALALDVQAALRPDLRIVVMSATLDVGQLSQLLPSAPVIESTGRAFEVELRYRDRPATVPVEQAVAEAVRDLVASEYGSLLAFLPGRAEIERTAERLAGRLPDNCVVHMLHGAIEPRAQDAAIRPAPAGRRKIVLATSIAETSLTLDGVRLVIDSGLSRVPRYEPDTGLTRLETVKAAKSSIAQRAGRAGRTEPGIALRLWRQAATAGLPERPVPEIRSADLAGLALDLAGIGIRDPRSLRWLDPPPQPAWQEAVALLAGLGAIDADGAPTELGTKMRRLALAPRLAAMVVGAASYGQARQAAEIALLISERGLGGDSADLEQRWEHFHSDRSERAKAVRRLAAAMSVQFDDSERENTPPRTLSVGALVSLAWPDRIAISRGDGFLLANGSGARIEKSDALARQPFLVIAELHGKAASARIGAAAAISREEIEALHRGAIAETTSIDFDGAALALRPRTNRRLGAIVLSSSLWRPPRPSIDEAMLAAIRTTGLARLNWDGAARRLRDRVAFLHRTDQQRWPDVGDDVLLAGLETWLAPFLDGAIAFADIGAEKLRAGLFHLLASHGTEAAAVEREAPEYFLTPAGARHALRYDGEQVVLSARVQEFFGLRQHPTIAAGRIPLTLELLSPAMRPIQVTRDLPGFWAGSWRQVRTEMRGRYPKHEWPENPAEARPTTRAKPRA